MRAQCNQPEIEFQGLGRRRVVGSFTGGHMTPDAGALVLREVEQAKGIIERFAACFTDHRDQARVEHSVYELLAQRIYGLCAGYEDLIDHDRLRRQPFFALLAGKKDVLGQARKRTRDQGIPLAGKSTLNRLEQAPLEARRYQKISHDQTAIDQLLVELFLEAHRKAPEQIILDLDATDDPLHGNQEGRFFHGYYRHYCYLPLYIFCGRHLLCARLRPSNIDAAAGSLEEIKRIVAQIRERWPKVEIVLRGDGGFARDYLMTWCERQEVRVEYVFGLGKNPRLTARIARPLERVRRKSLVRGVPVRTFRNLRYRTRDSWSARRRVVAKVEHLPKGSNPRFVVTSLPKRRLDARALYEELYCGRGEMENRIKEQQLDLFADRTSTATMRGNQLRLYVSSLAYALVTELRRVGLRRTKLASSYVSTIRTKLFKVAAQLEVTARRVVIRFDCDYPYADLLGSVVRAIQARYRPMRC